MHSLALFHDNERLVLCKQGSLFLLVSCAHIIHVQLNKGMIFCIRCLVHVGLRQKYCMLKTSLTQQVFELMT